MSDFQHIPLSKLTVSAHNVRKTEGADTALAELAASIASHGLLQSLVVRKGKRGKYEIVAGQRRFRALSRLAEQGTITRDHSVLCQVRQDDASATEISLAENVAREPMHPADEFEAFRDLIDEGASVADIAARFGYSETTIEKRLRLARVSPVIIAAYREGEINLDAVMAFAVTDDHAAQERVWSEGSEWIRRDADAIRDALTEDEVSASDRRVRFVTLEAYQSAGGAVRRDLFSEGEEGVFILDVNLLDTLAREKLQQVADEARAEGWKWVEIQPVFDYPTAGEFRRRYAEAVPLSEDEQAELTALEAERDAFYDIEDELTDEQQDRFDAVGDRIDELTYDREEIWPEETLAIAGAIISIDHHGEISVQRGFVRPEDMPAKKKPVSDDDAPANGKAAALPAALFQTLSVQRTAALSATMISNPDIALVAVVHAFALKVFYQYRGDSCLDLIVSPQMLRDAEGSKAAAVIEEARSRWSALLPSDPGDLWRWCMTQLPETLLGVLGFCAALTVDATQRKGEKPNAGRLAHADALARALEFDLSQWFTPTAENFFSRVTKQQTLKALQEAKGVPAAPAWSNLKKGDLAVLAEQQIAGTGWLPEPMRPLADEELLAAE